MNIVYIATDSYMSLLGISLLSLLKNSLNLSELNIYILSPDLKLNNQKIISNLSLQFNRKINFIDISNYKIFLPNETFYSGFHSIVFARLLLTKYLPSSINTILYLDCDTIVCNPIDELQKISLDNYAFAAVPELYMPRKQKINLGLSPEDKYYNSGVLFINLKYWRTNNLTKIFLSYLNENSKVLLYPDQDILNHCCKGNILTLCHKFNFPPVLRYFPRYFIKKYQPAYYCNNKIEYKNILERPTIIHFLGEERPWMRGNFSPYRQIYYYYKSLSPWKDQKNYHGKEIVLFLYHILNHITFVCPWFRKIFTELIGIRYYNLIKKKY